MVGRMSWCTKNFQHWAYNTLLWTRKTQPSGSEPSDPTPRQATPPHPIICECTMTNTAQGLPEHRLVACGAALAAA